jgi:hypothetical protein
MPRPHRRRPGCHELAAAAAVEDAPLALKQPFDIDAVLLAEVRDLLVLQRQRRLDLLIGKIAGCGNISDTPAHGLFELSPTRRRFAIVVTREKCQILGDCALDPLVRHADMTILPLGQCRLLPGHRPEIRCCGQQLFDQRLAPSVDQMQILQTDVRVKAALRDIPGLSERNGALEIMPCSPVSRRSLGLSPSLFALLAKPEVCGGFG